MSQDQKEEALQTQCAEMGPGPVMDGLAKDPAFSVLTASHTDGGRGGKGGGRGGKGGGRGGKGGGRGGKGGGRGGSATLAPDAFKANQSSEPELDVFPVMGFGTLGGL